MRFWLLVALCLVLGVKDTFAEGAKPPVALFLIGEDEYDTKTTLPVFAKEQIEPLGIRCDIVHADEDRSKGFPGIERLAQADLLVMSVRRRSLPQEQMDVFKRYIASKKPIVAIRTSSHAFALRMGDPPAGHAVWPEFDREILGCHYTGHFGVHDKNGTNTLVWLDDKAAKHPILRDLGWQPKEEVPITSSLYKSAIVSDKATVLLWGKPVGETKTEPVAWTNTADGRRVFYTSLGHSADFKLPAFQQLLKNGVLWGLEK
jgi:hypothetical protein